MAISEGMMDLWKDDGWTDRQTAVEETETYLVIFIRSLRDRRTQATQR